MTQYRTERSDNRLRLWRSFCSLELTIPGKGFQGLLQQFLNSTGTVAMLPNMKVLYVLTSVLIFLVFPAVTNGDNLPGTTENIHEIFVGRCYDYKFVRYKGLLPEVSEDCESLWNKFFMAFSYMAPCAVNRTHYTPFVVAARQEIPENKSMFWSGVKELAHEYGEDGHRYVTLEDTLLGYVVDGLVWCGQEITPGMNYSRCPSWKDCPSEASEAYWASASIAFASSSSGQVTVMLTGSRPDRPAYTRNSFFGQYELPSLSQREVTEVNVLLTHALDTPEVETCSTGSLLLLKDDVLSQGLGFSCIDDPQAILHLLCSDDPASRECQLVSSHLRGSKSEQDQLTAVMNTKMDRFQELLTRNVTDLNKHFTSSLSLTDTANG